MICSSISQPIYLFFSEGLPPLLYYSHFLSIFVSLLVGTFVFYKDRTSLLNKLMFGISVSFSLWALFNLFLWTSNNTDVVFFLWSLFGMLQGIISILCVYFVYVFLGKKDVSLSLKTIFAAILMPLILLTPTHFNLSGFNFELCGASGFENVPFLYYYTLTGVLAMLWIFVLLLLNYRKADQSMKTQILLIGAGIEFFLLSFFTASFVASYLNDLGWVADYSLEFYGLFGIVIFLVFIAYLITKFKLFNVRVIGANALVISMWILTGSILFIQYLSTIRLIVGLTLAASITAGIFLIRGVRREVEQRERIEKLASELQVANTHLEELNRQKSEFVSFASHQLRSPLTSILGNSSLILEGDVGPISGPVRDIIKTIMDATKTQINVVESYLNSSRIELGTMKYTLVDMDFKTLAEQVMNEQKPNIEAKGLTFGLTIDASKTYKIKADPDKFKQVLMNIVDNSLKYTPKGSIQVSLLKDDVKGTVTFKVSDTGVGIRADVMPKLFRKFSRAENANEANIHGTGLGLYIARDIVQAHGGKVWAESEGEGEGSQFYVEVPEAK